MRSSLFATYTTVACYLKCEYRQFASKPSNFSGLFGTLTNRMGLSLSRANAAVHPPVPEWTSIDSKPVDKLYEPIAISTRIPPKTLSRIRAQEKTYAWTVEFEVDVAYLQRRFKMCTVPTSLSEDVERILVTPDMIRSMIEDNKVGIDDLCNICGLHMTLKGDGQKELSICLIVDISRDGHTETEAIGSLRRRIYGYTNQEPQEHMMS
eukprot:TRINITY_DN40666_c0_g1_i1.p2 TRINITY_DN40666_c0_g1~~TRINITY_DN40666_c0_g1_i1.p2  ORF type:complete len:208 (+),score=18.00 TRINITY_DN40666_c0_g1_i1:293-916(+)